MIRYPGRLFFTLLLLLVSSFGSFAQFEKPQEVEEKNIYQIVDEEPQFPGGIEGMAKFIQRNLVYPQAAI